MNKEKKEKTNEKVTESKNKLKKTLVTILFVLIGVIVMICVINIGLYYCSYYESLGNGRQIEMAEKPIIYLYPKQTTELSVTLGKPENITCSYPQYDKDGWQVIAEPDGNIIDKQTGRNLYSLYWEGINNNKVDFKEGFVVKAEDTIKFLEEKLAVLGLNEREAEEFIVYWLPKLQENKYNLIRFASMDEINEGMPLNFSVQPDTVIRVLMQYKGLDKPIEIKEQKLTTPERKGFVAVEWGGSEITDKK